MQYWFSGVSGDALRVQLGKSLVQIGTIGGFSSGLIPRLLAFSNYGDFSASAWVGAAFLGGRPPDALNIF